jgi:glycosyltransferase involved in cell wall biosynthesis
MIYIIVPFSRPEMLQNVLANVAKQTVPCSLIIVENGRALGTTPTGNYTILQSHPPHQSTAKNLGIDFVRKSGGRFVAIFDDDDYYSPNYLLEASKYLDKYAIVGKNQHFIYDHQGLWLLNPFQQNMLSDWAQGATQVFDLNKVGHYPVLRNNEDVEFCHNLLKRGGQVFITSILNFCYMRRSAAHTYQADIVNLYRSRGGRPVFLGTEFDPGYVDGSKPWGR